MTDITTRLRQIQAVLLAAAEVAGDASDPINRELNRSGDQIIEVGTGPIHRLKRALKELET